MHRFIVAILLLAAPHGAFAATGELFAEPNFIPLGKAGAGIGWGWGPSNDTGTLGDVDGDGDLDLVVAWTRMAPQWGWMVASNDGLGGLVPTHNVARPSRERPGVPIVSISGDDFDGDGLLDLAFAEGLNLELWHNRGEDGFATILQLPNVYFVGLADGEGDGDVDLLVMEYDDESLENYEGTSQATLWYNDGDAAFVRSDRFTLDSEEGRWPRLWPAEQSLGAGGAARLLWFRSCWEFEEAGPTGPTGVWLTQPWAASAEPPLFLESMDNPCYSTPLQAGRDGLVDLVGVAETTATPSEFFVNAYFFTYHGLALWRLDASGVVAHHTLLGSQVHVEGHPLVSDLNGDGLPDVAVIDDNEETGPALVVLLGQRNGVPVLEGRYRLSSTIDEALAGDFNGDGALEGRYQVSGTGSEMLAGDLNGDGAADLVVLGRVQSGRYKGPTKGGAFVFINQNSPPTAVAVEPATPSAFVLDANYPNPFNPATTIPLTVPAGAEAADVAIYNLLGQLVRQVWSGPLAAGEHRLTWDGRDGHGQLVSSGVYLYQLRVDDQLRTRKMVKLE